VPIPISSRVDFSPIPDEAPVTIAKVCSWCGRRQVGGHRPS